MISRRFVLAAAAACVAASAFPIRVNAQAAKPDPGQFVKVLSDRAINELAGKDLPVAERNRRFRVLLRESFDVDSIARNVLGRYWRVATEAERADYLRLFEDLIVQIYASRFAEYSGESYKIAQSRPAGTDTVITGEIVRPTATNVRVDWRVTVESGSLKIIDVIVEGVSMVVTQRDEFGAVIQRGGGKVSGLLDTMREKTASLKSEGDPSNGGGPSATALPTVPESRTE